MEFPVIHSLKSGTQVEVVAALRLASLLESALLEDSLPAAGGGLERSQAREVGLQRNREALLGAVASWGTGTELEMRLTVMPNLLYKAQGQVQIHLLLRCQAWDEEDAKEILVTRYLALLPVLGAIVPEACWQPVLELEELNTCLAPLKATHGVSLHRKRERLTLSAQVNRSTIGFGSTGPVAGEPAAAMEHLYPWIPSLDDWSRLIETLSGQLDPLQVVVRLRAEAETAAAVDEQVAAIHACESILAGQANQLAHAPLLGLLRDFCVQRLAALQSPCFHLGVYLLAAHPVDSSLPNLLGRSLSESSGKELLQGAFAWNHVQPEDALASSYFFDQAPFSLREAACAFRLPSPPSRTVAGLPVQRFRTALASLPGADSEKPGAVELFANVHQGQMQPVRIDPDSRMRHCFVVGQTGTGKSALMESLALQDIRAGRGVCVIDPHGDMVENILGKIPASRADEVIVFDLVDRDHPVGFNILEWKTLEERDLIIDELYRTLDRIYDMRQAGGPLFETHYRNMLKLLLGETPRGEFMPTALEFIKCYTDRNFRKWLKGTVTDQQVLDFVGEAEDVTGDASLKNVSPYITSKFGRFVNDTTLKRIIGQSRSRIDFEEVINGGKILLVKLGKGRFGSEVSALLANMIVLRFKLAAMKRGELPAQARRDFFLYVDEAHNLPQENFAELLSEARKFRLGLVLATQYCSQITDPGRKGADLLSSVFGNVGTTIIFRVGVQDAELLAKGLTPHFGPLDIINLPNYHGYTRMNLGQGASLPFSFRTRLEESPVNLAQADELRAASRRRFGRPAAEVDQEIYARSRFWKDG